MVLALNRHPPLPPFEVLILTCHENKVDVEEIENIDIAAGGMDELLGILLWW